MKRRLFDFYASMYWAILPEHLQEMYDIYCAAIERKGIGVDFDPEAVAAKIGRPLDNTRKVETRDDIAIIPILGPIFPRANIFTEISNATSIDVLATDFNAALDNPSISSIVFNVNTPGGAVDGVSEFAGMVFDARGRKPIMGYSGNLAASAGLWILSAMGEVVIGDTASLGSIGVIGGVEVSEDKKIKYFVSEQSPNKRPDPRTESGKAQFQSHVNALADVFIKTVARNRGMSEADVITKGGAGGLRVGQSAVDAGLADRIGTLEGVISELSDSETRMKKIKPKSVVSTLDVDAFTDAASSHYSESQTGANTMADKAGEETENDQKPTAVVDPPKEDKPAVDAKETKADASELETLKADKAKAEQESQARATELAAEKQAREALETRMAAMEKKDRDTRFSIVAKDWTGDKSVHLDMLEHFATAEKEGEQSARFKAYVTQQNAVAEQLKQSALFREIGSGAATEGSAAAEIDAQARKISVESGGKTTYQQAYDQIYSSNADLRNRVDTEERHSVN